MTRRANRPASGLLVVGALGMGIGSGADGVGATEISVGVPVPDATAGVVSPDPVPAPIRAVLDAMVRAWNDDDLEGHVSVYASDATYTLADGVRRGRAGILEALGGFVRGDDLVGELSFEDLDHRPLGPSHALVTGRFVLLLEGGGASSGRFSLVFSDPGDGWTIVHDHSS